MLDVQRRLASQILKCGRHRVSFDASRLEEIKEAITKADVRVLINSGAIIKKQPNTTSKFWARKIKKQKKAGKQKGHGSRKGKASARTNPKNSWMNKIRLQRSFLKGLRNKKSIATNDYHDLYAKSKGGFFRSLRHIELYVKEKGLIKNEKK